MMNIPDKYSQEIYQEADKYFQEKGGKAAKSPGEFGQRLRRYIISKSIEIGDSKLTVNPDTDTYNVLKNIVIKKMNETMDDSTAMNMEKYGVPAGAELEDDSNYEDTPPMILFDAHAIGGDYKGRRKFRGWLEEVFLPDNPKLQKKINSLNRIKRSRAMKRISYIIRRSIAINGLQPEGVARYSKGRLREIEYPSNKIWTAGKK